MLTLLAFSVLSFVAADTPDDPAKLELARLQGKWTVSGYEREGRVLPAADAMKIKFEFKDNKQILLEGIGFTGAKEAELKLDAGRKIKEMDITPADGRNKGKAFLAIYELEGDQLKICAAAPGEPRPKEFATKAGSKSVLITLTRDKK